MKQFLDKDFLLQTDTARELYHEHAAKMPIIDYHCHLSPELVAKNQRFDSIAQIWLAGDHYKWRAMRSNGVDERYITGNATDWEKFLKWAETVPYTFRNPLYHWTHLELKTAFGIEERLNPETAKDIYDECNRQIATDEKFCPQGMMEHYNVEVVCTTDDPADTLEWHAMSQQAQSKMQDLKCRMLPTWRPDAAMDIEKVTWREYIKRLQGASGVEITHFTSLIDALKVRHDYFDKMGCRLSDHGLEQFYDEPCNITQLNDIVRKALSGQALNELQIRKYKHAFLVEQGRMDAASGWTQQYHYGVIRNNNSRMFHSVGPDTGFDSMAEVTTARALAHFLDELDRKGNLAKTIIYCLNPTGNEMIATMLGNFQDGSVPGKIQFGSGWWFMDQKDGMERQMMALSNMGLLSRFVGMLTDSRSFLSYPRHEYFRRILCNILGNEIEAGMIPYTGYERTRMQQMVEDIAYNNAKNFFKF